LLAPARAAFEQAHYAPRTCTCPRRTARHLRTLPPFDMDWLLVPLVLIRFKQHTIWFAHLRATHVPTRQGLACRTHTVFPRYLPHLRGIHTVRQHTCWHFVIQFHFTAHLPTTCLLPRALNADGAPLARTLPPLPVLAPRYHHRAYYLRLRARCRSSPTTPAPHIAPRYRCSSLLLRLLPHAPRTHARGRASRFTPPSTLKDASRHLPLGGRAAC